MEISRDDIRSDSIVEFPVADRFMKIPIQNYLDVLEVEPILPQIALINAINSPKYRFVTAALSRRTGKSYITNIIGQVIVLQPGTEILIIAPNYALSQISWDLQRSLIKQFGLEIERSNAKDKVIELSNGSIVRMGSVSQADSVVGRSYDLIIFDEAALNDGGEDVFNVQLRPTLDKINSKAAFISTPRGKNWFYKFWMRGFSEDFPTWASLRSTYRDNPRVDMADIDDARKSMSSAFFAQEYECDFVALEGQVYNFNKTDHVVEIDISKIQVFDVIAGLDVGFRDATAFCVIVTDGSNFYVVDEYLASNKTTSQHAEVISEMIDKWSIDFVYIDSAAQQTKYDFAMHYDISTVNAKKSVNDGLGYVAAMLDNDRLLIGDNCIHTIEMFDNYRWDAREGLRSERPVHDEFSHMADAIRYAMFTHSMNVDPLG